MKVKRSDEFQYDWIICYTKQVIRGIPGIVRDSLDKGWQTSPSKDLPSKFFSDSKHDNSCQKAYRHAAFYILQNRGDRKFLSSGRLEHSRLKAESVICSPNKNQVAITYKGEFLPNEIRGFRTLNDDIAVYVNCNGFTEYIGISYNTELSEYVYNKATETLNLAKELTISDEFELRLQALTKDLVKKATA